MLSPLFYFLLIFRSLLLKLVQESSWYQSHRHTSMANLTSEILDSGSKLVKEQIDSARAMSSVAHSSLPTLSVKLGEKNYSYWRSQTLPALAAYELDGFVTATGGSSLSPTTPKYHSQVHEVQSFTQSGSVNSTNNSTVG
ncbi:uncharacterized protein LOC116144630 [Pistacia vera]|uniref:uncharacterized protein LOC116144630 n=1 Tax=Pistacia vera TaxID=55513 RepID=UPI0012631D62|nr:uncharacterized protein LOC116144630 [Pistacia vera]